MEEADQILLISLTSHLLPFSSLFSLSSPSSQPGESGSAGGTPVDGISGLVARKEVYSICRILWDTCKNDAKSQARLEKGPGGYDLKAAKGVAKKHKMCTEVSEGIKAMGYDGDCGYNTLLYPTIQSTRGLLQFLVRKLPVKEEDVAVKASSEKDGDGDGEDFLSTSETEHILNALKQFMAQPWVISNGLEKYHGERPVKRYGGNRRFRSFPASPEKFISTQVPNYPKTEMFGTVLELSAHQYAQENRKKKLAEMRRREREKREMGGDAGDGRSFAERAKAAFEAHGGGRNISAADYDIDSLLEKAQDGRSGAKAGRFANAVNFGKEESEGVVNENVVADVRDDGATETEEEIAKRKEAEEKRKKQEREDMLNQLRKELDDLQHRIKTDQQTVEDELIMTSNAKSLIPDLTKKMESLKKTYNQHKKTLDLLPDAANNAKKLQEIIDQSLARYQKLLEEWDAHKDPLEGELDRLKGKRDQRRKVIEEKIEEIKRLRADINVMADSIREKEARALKLKAEYEKMPKNFNRSVYTYRIMDIINSITKQKAEIKRVVADIREVQEVINRTSETLLRTEAVADESLFQAAKTGEGGANSTEAYKKLSVLRGTFESLVATVQEIGKSEKAARNFETRTETLLQRVSGQSVDGLIKDLKLVKKENKELAAKLKATMK